jgi:hypothetical protein
MEFGIFNLMGSRDPEKPTAEIFAEVAEQTRLADELGYAIAWFAEHHFSNYCLCASPLMMVAHCASITKKIRLGTAVIVLPLYNPARLAAEIATADALSNGRLMLGVGAGYQPYEFERFGAGGSVSSCPWFSAETGRCPASTPRCWPRQTSGVGNRYRWSAGRIPDAGRRRGWSLADGRSSLAGDWHRWQRVGTRKSCATRIRG